MPAPLTTVFASSVGTAATVALDWMGAGPITMRLTAGSTTATAGVRVEVTLNDITGISTVAVVWTGLSSQNQTTWLSTAALSSGALITNAGIVDSQLIYQFTTPLAAIRLNCSGATGAGMRMDVIQGKSF
jgi:hypothetical protein